MNYAHREHLFKGIHRARSMLYWVHHPPDERNRVGLFSGHLPRNDMNKQAEGMDERQSGLFGRRVAHAQGAGNKHDAKDAKQTTKSGKGK